MGAQRTLSTPNYVFRDSELFEGELDNPKSIDAAATDVQAAITRAGGQLPVDLPSPPTFTKNNPNDQPILYIALASDTMTVGQLYDLANTQVGERISIVSGVSNVIVYGVTCPG